MKIHRHRHRMNRCSSNHSRSLCDSLRLLSLCSRLECVGCLDALFLLGGSWPSKSPSPWSAPASPSCGLCSALVGTTAAAESEGIYAAESSNVSGAAGSIEPTQEASAEGSERSPVSEPACSENFCMRARNSSSRFLRVAKPPLRLAHVSEQNLALPWVPLCLLPHSSHRSSRSSAGLLSPPCVFLPTFAEPPSPAPSLSSIGGPLRAASLQCRPCLRSSGCPPRPGPASSCSRPRSVPSLPSSPSLSAPAFASASLAG
mmetsp:Transcript_2160/g.5829  ORF Transcript_2160/g.5829 Transcript_2160/m.5829 type:complete len:259 (+) Transcript_2160:587-1363(+)